ncbi:hypothetical protein LTR95_007573 [Oleoguttula sp. CCFEE 5521]
MSSTEAAFAQAGIVLRGTRLPESLDPEYDGHEERTSHIKAGWKRHPDCAAFAADTIWDANVSVMMRDGVRLKTDIFRPAQSDSVKVPALIAWSPYNKSGRGFFKLDSIPGRVGVPKARLSGFEKFEAPDPAEWTARGYAVVNCDTRGVNDSEGNIVYVVSYLFTARLSKE